MNKKIVATASLVIVAGLLTSCGMNIGTNSSSEPKVNPEDAKYVEEQNKMLDQLDKMCRENTQKGVMQSDWVKRITNPEKITEHMCNCMRKKAKEEVFTIDNLKEWNGMIPKRMVDVIKRHNTECAEFVRSKLRPVQN